MRTSLFPRFSALLGLSAALCTATVQAQTPTTALPVDVLTYHNDAAVTGQYPHETVLTPANVNASAFGKKFAAAVDGQVYAQPLYVAGLYIPGQDRHNVVFVVTEHDSVYAFDADTGATLWQRNFLSNGTAPRIETVPYTDLPGQCTQITPELGITATPALDVASGTLYVAAMTKETFFAAAGGTNAVSYYQRLHALDLGTGAEKANSPVAVEAAVPGTGDGGTTVTFIPLDFKERPGLVLLNGVVYTSWSSHCDVEPYHGWVIGYDAATLAQVNVYNVTPNGQEASFWDGGAAPAVDAAGNLYIGAGNGTFDVQNADGSLNPSGVDIGESFIRLSTTDNHLAAADWFTPYNKDYLNDHDLDTGSAGTILFDVNGAHLMTSAGKAGTIYILNRDNLGHFTPGADTGAVQTVPAGAGGITGGLFGCPAFFNSAAKGPTLYFSAVSDHLRAFVLDPATGKITGAASSQSAESFGYPGTVPSISANNGANGVLWALESGSVLRAYDADNLGTELYNSNQAANSRDALGSYVKFTTPIIAQGAVYAGTESQMVAYGLLTPTPAADVTAQVNVKVESTNLVSSLIKQKIVITNQGATPLTGPLSLVVDGLNKKFALANATGTTSTTTPRASFYLDIPLPGNTLAPGATAVAKLKFAATKRKTPGWTARVLAGSGRR